MKYRCLSLGFRYDPAGPDTPGLEKSLKGSCDLFDLKDFTQLTCPVEKCELVDEHIACSPQALGTPGVPG